MEKERGWSQRGELVLFLKGGWLVVYIRCTKHFLLPNLDTKFDAKLYHGKAGNGFLEGADRNFFDSFVAYLKVDGTVILRQASYSARCVLLRIGNF